MASDGNAAIDELQVLRTQFLSELKDCRDEKCIEAVRIKYLSKKGLLPGKFALLGKLSPEERPKLGQELNRLKTLFQTSLKEKLKQIEFQKARASKIDITLPGDRDYPGKKHPLLQVLDDIKKIFSEMGFSIEEGPEVESDYYNFEALNIPKDHPARDMHDTFYLPGGYLLRTHTSPVQIRVMEQQKPPIRMIAPGRCFRKDTPDASHSPFFYQVEGLAVDQNISFADLKGVIAVFARKMFGRDVNIRFRPSFFPFTEPSAEYDFTCVICGGKGCRTCKGTGWLEISGAGMVDPEVFKAVGYDPERYTGYAFGMGVERLAMLKYQIDDIRLFYENDLRFLEQF
ncbi:phenylalanine--tRNA ligase alpha subunit [bacterium BMS3Abin05]|nr:phenylalanine--tRNA ligase alpha subunit [bacterium BMS3Abin05]GBE27351.1 phenylalanine--tRNA ligase alpha subunit [bacterium BMS3Bbin03]HDZ11817.1 phenylalanine--tRNA ligase subunit alpha [Bacteroidota bacterium]